MKLYKPEDFFDVDCHPDDSRYLDYVADRANEILTKEIEKLPKVYGGPISDVRTWFVNRLFGDTYSARLIDIQKLENNDS